LLQEIGRGRSDLFNLFIVVVKKSTFGSFPGFSYAIVLLQLNRKFPFFAYVLTSYGTPERETWQRGSTLNTSCVSLRKSTSINCHSAFFPPSRNVFKERSWHPSTVSSSLHKDQIRTATFPKKKLPLDTWQNTYIKFCCVSNIFRYSTKFKLIFTVILYLLWFTLSAVEFLSLCSVVYLQLIMSVSISFISAVPTCRLMWDEKLLRTYLRNFAYLRFEYLSYSSCSHVACMGEMWSVYKILVRKLKGRRPIGRPRRRCGDNIRMDLQEIE